MGIPVFLDEDAHYEYEREKYESEIPDWDELYDRLFDGEADDE